VGPRQPLKYLGKPVPSDVYLFQTPTFKQSPKPGRAMADRVDNKRMVSEGRSTRWNREVRRAVPKTVVKIAARLSNVVIRTMRPNGVDEKKSIEISS
jgi:hypothetical protein